MLAFAPSKIFQLYYFRMFISLIVVGFLHGFILLPLFLSMVGIEIDSDKDKLGENDNDNHNENQRNDDK